MPQKPTIPIEKICPSCQKPFPVCPPGKSSRKYPPFETVFHSRECAARGRFRTGTECNDLSESEAGYIAGFLDGEGSVMLYLRKDDVVALRVEFTNRSLETIERIRSSIGVGNIVRVERSNTKHHIIYNLLVNSTAAASLLQKVINHMTTKKQQAELAIDFFDRIKNPALKADRTWQFEYRARMQDLNKRGP